MDRIIVTGGKALSGQIPIAGAKNACLALMPATLLSEEPLTLTNAPRLSDIKTMTALLQSLGVEVTSNLKEAMTDSDVVYALRIQLERQANRWPTLRYRKHKTTLTKVS